MTCLRIGTRASALARRQTESVVWSLRALRPSLAIEVIELTTPGDDQSEAPLERMEGIGWFTSTLERALMEDRIDLAVHSYKDLPVASVPELVVFATPERGPVEDVLCSRHGARLDGLPRGARIGTSSLRRQAQLRGLRPDLRCLSLRGNVPTRLGRVTSGDLDAVVLARAGLERLDLMGRATEVFPVSRFLPAPGQGALAVQGRATDRATLELATALHHAPTHRAVLAEREVLRALRGGCSVPVGAFARETGSTISLDAGVFSLDGTESRRVRLEGEEPLALGQEAGLRLIRAGAARIIDDAMNQTTGTGA